MNLESIRENKGKTILQFSVPAIIAMVLTSLITITDGFFTGNYVGKEGIAAINLGLPIVYLYLGLGLMVSVGGSVLAGMALGAGDKDKSNAVFNQTMLTSVIFSFAVSLVLMWFLKPIVNTLHVNEQVADYFLKYYTVMLAELPIMVINNGFGMFIRAEGNPQFFMKVSAFNVLSNIVLDYFFARWLRWGITGIAMASLITTAICLVGILHYFIRRSSIFKFRKFKFVGDVLKSTILNGSSEFIGEMSMCITMYAYNFVIIRNIGVDGVTAFTIVGYAAYIFSMIIIGFGQGSSPLISFTYGAKEQKLARSIRRRTNIFVLCAGVILMLIMLLISDWYSGIFVKNDTVKDMVRAGIWIFNLSFLFSGTNTITSFYFTSIGRAKESAIISSLRGMIVLLICIFTLPMLFGMTGVWMVAPITEAITVLVSIYFIYKNDLYQRSAINLTREEREPYAASR